MVFCNLVDFSLTTTSSSSLLQPPPLPPPVPQERVLSNHQRIARAVAKIDEQFQQQMSKASATLNDVDRAGNTRGGGLPHASTNSSTGIEKNRDLAIMVASDSAKVFTLSCACRVSCHTRAAAHVSIGGRPPEAAVVRYIQMQLWLHILYFIRGRLSFIELTIPAVVRMANVEVVEKSCHSSNYDDCLP